MPRLTVRWTDQHWTGFIFFRSPTPTRHTVWRVSTGTGTTLWTATGANACNWTRCLQNTLYFLILLPLVTRSALADVFQLTIELYYTFKPNLTVCVVEWLRDRVRKNCLMCLLFLPPCEAFKILNDANRDGGHVTPAPTFTKPTPNELDIRKYLYHNFLYFLRNQCVYNFLLHLILMLSVKNVNKLFSTCFGLISLSVFVQ